MYASKLVWPAGSSAMQPSRQDVSVTAQLDAQQRMREQLKSNSQSRLCSAQVSHCAHSWHSWQPPTSHSLLGPPLELLAAVELLLAAVELLLLAAVELLLAAVGNPVVLAAVLATLLAADGKPPLVVVASGEEPPAPPMPPTAPVERPVVLEA
jgi:hypothetical protein